MVSPIALERAASKDEARVSHPRRSDPKVRTGGLRPSWRRRGDGVEGLPGARCRLRALPREGRRPARSGPRGARHRAAVHPPGRGHRARARRTACRGRHADRLRQDALLQRAGPQCDSGRVLEPCPLPVSDQGAGSGPADGAGRACRRAPGRGRRGRRLHLRRRHAAGRPPRDRAGSAGRQRARRGLDQRP